MGGSGQRVGLIGGVIGAAFAYVSLRLLSCLFRYEDCSSCPRFLLLTLTNISCCVVSFFDR